MRGHGAGNPPGQGRGNPPRKSYGQSSSTALANPRNPIREPGDDINLSYLVNSMASITRPTLLQKLINRDVLKRPQSRAL